MMFFLGFLAALVLVAFFAFSFMLGVAVSNKSRNDLSEKNKQLSLGEFANMTNKKFTSDSDGDHVLYREDYK